MGRIGLGFGIIFAALIIVGVLAYIGLFHVEPGSNIREIIAISSTIIIFVGLAIGLYVASDPKFLNKK